MTRFKIMMTTTGALSLIAGAAFAQTGTYSIVQPTQTTSTATSQTQFVRPGDVSPEEYSRLLAEADRIRAYQASQGSTAAAPIYNTAHNLTSGTQPQTYEQYIAGRQQAQAQLQAQVQTQPQYQQQQRPVYQQQPVYQTPQPQTRPGYQNQPQTYQPPMQPVYVQVPTPVNRAYQPPANNPVIYATMPTVVGAAAGVHSVVKGDTLYSLSKRYGVPLKNLKSANGLSGNIISIGQRLTVPGAAAATPAGYSVPVQNTYPQQYTRPTQYNRTTGQAYYVPSSTQITMPTQGSRTIKAVQPVPPSGVYAVLPKDTLYSISRFACVNPYDVARLNGISDSTALTPGQKLSMPSGHCLN